MQRDRTLAGKIRDFFINFAKEIRAIAQKHAMGGNERYEIMEPLGKSDALTEIAETFDRAMEAVGEKEAAPDGETVYARNEGKRNSAIPEGSMKNEFHGALTRQEWSRYFETLKKPEYDADLYEDGQRAYMVQGGKLVLMEMQDTGEFSVVAVYTGGIEWYNDDIRNVLGEWEEGRYDESDIRIWFEAIAVNAGSKVFQTYDRHSGRFVPVVRKQTGVNRGTAGISGERNAHGAGVREGAVGQEQGDGSVSRFSLNKPVDPSDSDAFRNWFGESKIVNEDGSPKVMYHGSAASFTAFDKKKARSSGLYGRGFYFTDSDSHAGQYGSLYQVYLKVEKPLTPGGSTVTRAQVKKFLEAVAENEDDYSIENYGTYDVGEILKKVYQKDAFALIQDINATAIGDFVEAVKLFNEVNGTKYDRIVVPTETVVFEPTQIKSTTDNVGTYDPENPDIRFSLNNTASIETMLSEDQRMMLPEKAALVEMKLEVRRLATLSIQNTTKRLCTGHGRFNVLMASFYANSPRSRMTRTKTGMTNRKKYLKE